MKPLFEPIPQCIFSFLPFLARQVTFLFLVEDLCNEVLSARDEAVTVEVIARIRFKFSLSLLLQLGQRFNLSKSGPCFGQGHSSVCEYVFLKSADLSRVGLSVETEGVDAGRLVGQGVPAGQRLRGLALVKRRRGWFWCDCAGGGGVHFFMN